MIVMDDNYIDAFTLESFLIEESYNQARILAYANECVCLEKGDISSIQYINESLIDTVKNILNRIWEAIKGVFKKFRERVGELLTTDKAFLQKYKDVILKNNFKSRDVTDSYKYKIAMLDKAIESVPQFDLKKFSDKYNDAIKTANGATPTYTEKEFIKDYIPQDLTSGQKDPSDVTDCITIAIQGSDDSVDFDVVELDKQSLYNYCVNFEATSKKLDQIESKLQQNHNKITAELNKLLGKIQDNIDGKTSNNESAYSSVYNTVVYEGVETKSNDEKKDNTGKTGTGTGNSAVKADVNLTDINDVNKAAQGQLSKVTGTTDADVKKKIQTETKYISDASTDFFKWSCNIVSAVMTTSMAIYKLYMKILRLHARDFIGDTTDSKYKDTQEGGGELDTKVSFTPYDKVKELDNNNLADLVTDQATIDKYSKIKEIQNVKTGASVISGYKKGSVVVTKTKNGVEVRVLKQDIAAPTK